MSALRLVTSGKDATSTEQNPVKRLQGQPVAIRRPVLVTSLSADVEFQEWCETVAVACNRCQVRMDRALPRGTLVRLDVPNMKMLGSTLMGGDCVCQWECTPRKLMARAAGSVEIHGPAGYWVVELRFQFPRHSEEDGTVRALVPAFA